MSGSIKRQLGIAAATVAAASALWGAAMPSDDSMTPEGRQRELHHQYSEVQKRQREEERLAAKALGDAYQADRNRSAEVREAEKLARGLLRRVP
jgi:hypothetical protein